MLDRLKNYVRKVVGGLLGINSVVKTSKVITPEMSNSIEKWFEMYEDRGYWLNGSGDTLSLPSAISSEIARLVTLEFQFIVSSSENGSDVVDNPNTRAAFLQKCINSVTAEIWKHVEYCCAGGGIVFKPYIDGDKISLSVVQADCFFPTSFDSSGDVISGEFYEIIAEDNEYYTRREIHEWRKNDDTGTSAYVIRNIAYRSSNKESIGTEVPLTSVEKWADIEPVVTIDNVDTPLFAYMKIPLGNTTDRTSPIGVSVYANAVKLIANADQQYQRLLWEFESGERAIDASVDAFVKNKDTNKYELPVGRERLYRLNQLDMQSSNGKGLFDIFSPEFRDAAIKSGLNVILQKIEFACGLAYGTISDPLVVDKTAEEIKTSKQRSYSTVKLIQLQLEKALNAYTKACDNLATLYNLAPLGGYSTRTSLDDSIIVDAESERARDMQEVSQGLMKKWEYRVKWYGETPDKAKEMVGDEMTDEEILFGDRKKKEPESDNGEADVNA